eukprot:gene3551-4476_t
MCITSNVPAALPPWLTTLKDNAMCCWWTPAAFVHGGSEYFDCLDGGFLGWIRRDNLGRGVGTAAIFELEGKLDEAASRGRAAIEMWEKFYEPSHPNLGAALNNLADILHKQGESREALLNYNRAQTILRTALGEEHPITLSSMHNHATVYEQLGQYAAAKDLYTSVLNLRTKMLGMDHPQEDHDEALALYQRGLHIREVAYGPKHREVAQSLNNVATVLRAQKKYKEAKPLFLRCIAIWEEVHGKEHPVVATGLNNLAMLHSDMKKHKDAEETQLRALAICKKVFGPMHQNTLNTRGNLGIVLKAKGNSDEAKQMIQEVVTQLTSTCNLRQTHPWIIKFKKHL